MSTIKKVFTGALVLMLCSSIVGCTQPAQEAVSNPATASLDFSAGGPGDPNTPKPLPPDTEAIEYEVAPIKLNPALIYQSGEVISDDDFEFSNTKGYRASELPANIDAEKMIYFDGTSDIAEGKEYLFLDIDIKNIEESEKEFNVGSMNFIFADSDLLEVSETSEPCYFSAGANKNSKSYYSLILAPNEKRTITLGYIVDKSVVDGHSVYFFAGKGGGFQMGGNSDEPQDDRRQVFALQLS